MTIEGQYTLSDITDHPNGSSEWSEAFVIRCNRNMSLLQIVISHITYKVWLRFGRVDGTYTNWITII